MPARAGVGLKPQHVDAILSQRPDIGWFEIHAENYMGKGGIMHHHLQAVSEHYPLSIHGIGLSLGSEEGLVANHLAALKQLVERYQPRLVSEHLSWSQHQQVALNDLLPVPYTQEALDVFCRNIDQTQTILERQILIENPSSYFTLKQQDYSEHEFLVRVAQQAGCGILLDVNNVYVSACNHGFDAYDYIRSIPAVLVGEIHLAGHSVQSILSGEVRIDDHGSKVCREVWELYQFTLTHVGARPTLIEWDTNVPEWATLYEQAQLAQHILEQYTLATTSPDKSILVHPLNTSRLV
ncbi:hypothetical protein CW748_14355 [Alteromonadales bacterium alter-6D02]|nr:hypothetical protein CW748_14355 [Alteromonadales bacterium alter-6D02]